MSMDEFQPDTTIRLGAQGVTRRFGALVANDGITFRAHRGTIHAIVGGNGAGKSTLMRILQGMDAILVPGGFGERGVEGKIMAARYARENKIPYLGICLGMQVAVIEYARNVCKLPRAHSTEFDLRTPDPVIGLITEWQDEAGRVQMRDEASNKGGTMRLGVQACRLRAGSKSRAMYNAEIIRERHRHRYEFNNNYKKVLTDNGMELVAESAENELVEMIELPNHPFFVACQFHPEFTSTPRDGHPLFEGFVKAAREHHLAHQPAQIAPTPAAASSVKVA